MLTTRLPLALVIMEIAAELGEADAALEASWAPRTHNVEADALSNGETAGFDESRRVRLRPEDLRFRVLDRLLAQLPALEQVSQQARRQQPERKTARARQTLRQHDPW